MPVGAAQSDVGVPGCMQNEPEEAETKLVRDRVEGLATVWLDPVLVSLMASVVLARGCCTTLIWLGLTSRPPCGVPVVPAMDFASFTAARTFKSPAPCCVAGAPMSVAVLMRICLTSAGEGSAPRWVEA